MTRPALYILALALLAALAAGCGPGNDDTTSSPPNVVHSPTPQAAPQSAPAPALSDDMSSDASPDTVHITRTGKRYHRAGCRSLAKSDTPMSRVDAEARGLTPCHICKP